MLKFEKIGHNAILVDLHNDYSVMAIAKWIKDKKVYNAKFYISRNDVESFDLVNEMENVEFDSDMKKISYDLSEYITRQFNMGNFVKAINRYDYQQKCFERGNEMFERERVSHAK